MIITGGFFSWRYFHNNRDLIVAAFEPSKVVIEKLQKKYDDLLQSNQTVAVHVRSYSKQVHDAGLHFVGFQYFEDAMKKFPDNYTFVVFSDRSNWCKANFQKRFPNKKLVFIEGNDHIEDLFLMSFMKHQILSKSTYSWWAGYLNKNPNKVVIAPVKKSNWRIPVVFKNISKKFLTFIGKPLWSNEDYYLPDWTILYYNLEPYQQDIYDYEGGTSSVCPTDK